MALTEPPQQALCAGVMRPIPRMPAELRRRLTDGYRDDILRLQDLLGRDPSAWLEPR